MGAGVTKARGFGVDVGPLGRRQRRASPQSRSRRPYRRLDDGHSHAGREDDAIDEMQDRTYREMVRQSGDDSTAFEARTPALWIVHYIEIERLADRAMNIAERAIYVATGEIRS